VSVNEVDTSVADLREAANSVRIDTYGWPDRPDLADRLHRLADEWEQRQVVIEAAVAWGKARSEHLAALVGQAIPETANLLDLIDARVLSEVALTKAVDAYNEASPRHGTEGEG
jgi:hypothetical protein